MFTGTGSVLSFAEPGWERDNCLRERVGTGLKLVPATLYRVLQFVDTCLFLLLGRLVSSAK